MYLYDTKMSQLPYLIGEKPVRLRPSERYNYRGPFSNQTLNAGTRPSIQLPALEGLGLSTAELSTKLKFLSLFPHRVEENGNDVTLTPAVMDPKIYDGLEKYLVASKLQECLMGVMQKKEFRNMSAALVDLTKDAMRPEFAAFNHKKQVFAASVPKIVVMLAAFQLRHDLRATLNEKKPKPATLAGLFDLMRDDWAATQGAGGAQPFSRGVSLRGKLVLVRGARITLSSPKAPQLDRVFEAVPAGAAVTINFKSTGESKSALQTIVDDYHLKQEKQALKAAREELKSARTAQTRGAALRKVREATQKLAEARRTKQPEARRKLLVLGFRERMGIAVGGDVPASNLATSTVVRDVGFPYIASTLLQSGLYDTNRGGGLWLGADYWGGGWRGPLAGGSSQSATAGALAAFMTLLAQNRLVSPGASAEMSLIMQKVPSLIQPGTGSWFRNGLDRLSNRGSLRRVLAKVGLAGGADDCAFIEREVDLGGGRKKLLRYVAVGLRARSGGDLEQLIREFDKCILANNGLSAAQGGHTS